MPTLDTDIGGLTSNSYATADEANAYVDTLVPSTMADGWLDAGDEDRTRALIMATRLLDTNFEWEGSIATPSQALLWPRIGVLRPGTAQGQPASASVSPFDQNIDAILLPSDEIPWQVRDATAELARQLLAGDRIADNSADVQGITSLRAGSVALTFSGGKPSKPIPDAVQTMLIGLGTVKGRSGSGAVTIRRA